MVGHAPGSARPVPVPTARRGPPADLGRAAAARGLLLARQIEAATGFANTPPPAVRAGTRAARARGGGDLLVHPAPLRRVRFVGATLGPRPLPQAYVAQIARAADDLGYAGVLLPTGRSCEDAWV